MLPISLFPPFEKITSIDSQETEPLSHKTFKELMDERTELDLDYYLVMTKDATGSVLKMDGTYFLRAHLKYEMTKSPTTRQEIISAIFYKINPKKEAQFSLFCDSKELHANNSLFARFINAADPNLDPEKRGPERAFLALQFRKGIPKVLIQDLEKQKFWWELSKADNFFGAFYNVAISHGAGTDGYERSIPMAAENLKKAKELVPIDHDLFDGVLATCEEFAQATGIKL